MEKSLENTSEKWSYIVKLMIPEKKKNIKKIGMFMIPGIAFFLYSINTYALSDDNIRKVLENNKDMFVTNDMFTDFFRWLGWKVITGLKFLADLGEDMYKKAFELLTFSTGTKFENWIDTFEPLFIAILALSIMALGILLIVNHEKKPNAVVNILIMVAVVTCSFTTMNQFNKVVKSGVNAIVGDVTISNSAINDNLYDLYYIDRKAGGLEKMKKSKYGTYHYDKLTDKDIEYINMKETLNYKKGDLTKGGKEILSKRLNLVGKASDSGKNAVVDVKNGIGWNDGEDEDFFNEFYYRYKLHYFSTILLLLAYVIVFFAMTYKVVRIIFELMVHRILSVLYSADITGGQKTVKILVSMKDGYVVLLFTAILIKLFSMFNGYIGQTVPNNPFMKNVFILFAAIAVCDGPNIIEKLTGIDAGLRTGTGILRSGYYMARGAAGAMTIPAKMAFYQHMQNRMSRNIAAGMQMNQDMNSFNSPGNSSRNNMENGGNENIHGNKNVNEQKEANSQFDGNRSGSQNEAQNANVRSDNQTQDNVNVDNGSTEMNESVEHGEAGTGVSAGSVNSDLYEGDGGIDNPNINSNVQDALNGFDPEHNTSGFNMAEDRMKMEQDLGEISKPFGSSIEEDSVSFKGGLSDHGELRMQPSMAQKSIAEPSRSQTPLSSEPINLKSNHNDVPSMPINKGEKLD